MDYKNFFREINYTPTPEDKEIFTLSSHLHGVDTVKKALCNYMAYSIEQEKDLSFLKEYKMIMKWYYYKQCNLPAYCSNLDADKREALAESHDIIIYKCCGFIKKYRVNKFEPLIFRLYKLSEKIPLPIIEGVLYDYVKHSHLSEHFICEVMGNMTDRDTNTIKFVNDCRALYMRIKRFKESNFKLFDFGKNI